jgi:cyclase
MLKKRIIPCLDVKDGVVVKGIQFKNHEVVGDIVELAKYYSNSGADELVFYDITASSDNRNVDNSWVRKIAQAINIPFCVAGGINSIKNAEDILANGADKVSINSPALGNPNLIDELAARFGSQCVFVGIDSFELKNEYLVKQYTGDITKTITTKHKMLDWALEVVERGAGEIVLNCMNNDGVRLGYDIKQIQLLCDNVPAPVIASGGAGSMQDFLNLFKETKATGSLAATVFHKNIVNISALKTYLVHENIAIRKNAIKAN